MEQQYKEARIEFLKSSLRKDDNQQIDDLKKIIELGKKLKKDVRPDEKKSYIREQHDKKKLEQYKEKISKLLEIDKKISITKIAESIGITRQAIYKNIELNVFIENIKKK